MKNVLRRAALLSLAVAALAASARAQSLERAFGQAVVLARQACAARFEQVNGDEPLATCDVDAGVPGVVRPAALVPFTGEGEFDFALGADGNVGCTGGLRRDAGLSGRIQVFVGLSPWRNDYSKDRFRQCFESVITQLLAKDRVVYLEATVEKVRR